MIITDSVVHDYDAIRYLTGEEIKSVEVRHGRATRQAPLANTIRSRSS